MKKLTAICLSLAVVAFFATTVLAQISLFATSPLRNQIPTDANYTRIGWIFSARQSYEDYSVPNCVVPSGTNVPLVPITVTGGSPRAAAPIPATCNPALGTDGHMSVINYQSGFVYEFYHVQWNSARTAITALGQVTESISGDGITDNANFRTTASGILGTSGEVHDEDLTSCDSVIPHALLGAVPDSFINPSGYVSPAVGSETHGTAGSTGARMGDLYAIPHTVDVDAMTDILPYTRTILRTLQQYGIMLGDSGGQTSGNQAVMVYRNEPGAMEGACNMGSDDSIARVQREIAGVISTYGLYRVTGGTSTTTATPRPTATARPTGTPLTPIATSTPRPTSTVRPTSTGIGTPAFGCRTDITPQPLDIVVHCH